MHPPTPPQTGAPAQTSGANSGVGTAVAGPATGIKRKRSNGGGTNAVASSSRITKKVRIQRSPKHKKTRNTGNDWHMKKGEIPEKAKETKVKIFLNI